MAEGELAIIDPPWRGADREDLIAAGVVGLVHARRAIERLKRCFGPYERRAR